MTEVKVLIEGYAEKLENGWRASSTVCLVTNDRGEKIITDPGCNRELLMTALEKEGLLTSDIDFVFLSHRHPDHVLLAGIFENAKYVTSDNGLVYDEDVITEFSKNVLGENIELVNTPGHVAEHLALVVNTEKGKIGIAGDVIWWLDDEDQVLDINQFDHSAEHDMDMEKLVESRKKLLEMCDYIVPGHGRIFEVGDVI